jgi:transposase
MDDKDVMIDRLMRRIDSLLEQNAQLSRRYQKQVDQLTDEIKTLSAENVELKERIARLEKNSATSSKPPSSDIIHPQMNVEKKKKRKRGGQQGHPKHTREPFPAEAIDDTIIHKLPDAQVRRRQLVELPQAVLALQQISLPEKLYRVTEHRVQLYKTSDGKIVPAILPPTIRKTGLFSSDMIALVGYLKGRCHASYSTLRAIFADVFGLNIECGTLAKVALACNDQRVVRCRARIVRLVSPHRTRKVGGAQLRVQFKRPIDQRAVTLPGSIQILAALIGRLHPRVVH